LAFEKVDVVYVLWHLTLLIKKFGPLMKLTELLALNETTAAQHPQISRGVYGISAYSVDVDSAEDITPPSWLKEIGLLLKVNDAGEISEDVLDVAISYRLAKTKVMAEIPFDENNSIDEDYLMISLAINMQVGLSFLPPEDDTEESFLIYLDRMRKVCKAFFKRPNMDQTVMPVTNYIEYLFVNLLHPDRPFQVSDPYIISSYANVLREDRVDRLKEVIREETYSNFGGKDGFENMAKALMGKIYHETVAITSDAHKTLTEMRAAREIASQNSANDGKVE
jgi:hypothetical protein